MSKSIVLNCASWNLHSINNKCDEVMEHILDLKADLVFLCELWLKSDFNAITAKVKTYGYQLLHTVRKRLTKMRGGGIGLLFSDNLQVKKEKRIKTSYESFEYGIYSLKVDSGLEKVFLVSFYRYQEVNVNIFFDDYTNFIEQLVTLGKSFLLAGDINIHCETNNESSQNLKSILTSFGLKQNVEEPTNRFGHTIDVVISPADEIPVNSIEVRDMSLSDHYLVSFNIHLPIETSKLKEITYRNIKGIQHHHFSSDLAVTLSAVNYTNTLSDIISNYNSSLLYLLDKHAPEIVKVVKVVPKAPWFNSEYADLRRKRRKAEKKYRRSGLEIDRQQFVNLRKLTTTTAHFMKRDHIKSNLQENKGDTKMLYEVVNNLTDNVQHKQLPSSTDDKLLAQKFSDFFQEKIVNIRSEIGRKSLCSTSDNTSFSSENDQIENGTDQFLSQFEPTNTDELKNIISKHPIKTSHDDPLPPPVIKENLDLLLPVWVKIINKSLLEGDFSGLKSAVITPIIKSKGLDYDDLKNYRPISNLQFLSKLLERVVLKRLNSHMKSIGCFLSNQYGYKPAHNTETLLIKITNDLLIASDSKTATVLLLLDLSAAFDTADKVKLINILSREIKIRGNALNWFRSYLFGRTQKVKIRKEFSNDVLLEFGVPQGSVLGPVLFNIYLRSLYTYIEDLGCNIKGFADDHQIYLSFVPEFQYNILHGYLNMVVSKIFCWMNEYFLKLNPDKSKIIVFGTADILDKITINGIFLNNNCVRFVNNVKNLGFYLDSALTLDRQINEVSKSCFLSIKNISCIKHFLDYEQKRMLISSLVLSKMDYCNSMYIGTSSYNIRKLQSIQNSAARLVFGFQNNNSNLSMLNKLHWLPVKNRIMFKICVYVHKCLYEDAPVEMMNLLHPADSFIRTAKLKFTYTPDTAIGCKAFSVCAPKVWNLLPTFLRREMNLIKFKAQLKTFLFTDTVSTFYNGVLNP